MKEPQSGADFSLPVGEENCNKLRIGAWVGHALRFSCTTLHYEGPIVIDGCLNLKILLLYIILYNFINSFKTFLAEEDLNVIHCHCLESVTISSNRLKKISIDGYSNLRAIN